MQTLNLKEYTAIEYRYMGKSHNEIARAIEVPKQTIDEWFKNRGRLSTVYDEWTMEMNTKRQKHVEEKLYVTDDEIMAIITNVVRRFGRFILHGQRMPIMRNGEPVLDSRGNVRYYHVSFKPKVSDFFGVWRMQRVMQGQPTNIIAKTCPYCKSTRYRVS